MTKKTETFRELIKEDSMIPAKDQPESTSKKPQISHYSGETEMPRMSKPAPDRYQQPGLQNRKFQNLERGKIPVQETIDLHACTAWEAIQKLDLFIRESQQNNLHCLCVICGKGLHSRMGKPVLRNIVRAWLYEQKTILAYCPATYQNGSDGALYVLLKHKRQ